MQNTIISWTNRTWNPVHGCSKVSDGCKHCYAMELSLQRGWTTKPWTIQNENANVMLKPHKLHEPYKLGNEPQRVFVNSMSDMFHRSIPDWYRAVIFCVMLDLPQHVFQILTKRPEVLVAWPERFAAALQTPEFASFRDQQRNPHIKAAMSQDWQSPWAPHIWQGATIEDGRVIGRIDDLRNCTAHVKFISAEPLLGPYPESTDFTGIDWVIVGGESGRHMGGIADADENPRWMRPEWAQDLRDMCVEQQVAFFYKQDSGVRTEMRPWLTDDDDRRWKWEQYPGDLRPPMLVNAKGQIIARFDQQYDTLADWEYHAYRAERTALTHDDPDMRQVAAVTAAWRYQQAAALRPQPLTITQPTHTVTIHTSRINSSDPDRIDITMKSADSAIGKALAPTRDMVYGHKGYSGYQRLDDEAYTARYMRLLEANYQNNPALFDELLRRDRVVFVCYCSAGAFCHRHLAIDFLQGIASNHGVQVVRGYELDPKGQHPDTRQAEEAPHQMSLL